MADIIQFTPRKKPDAPSIDVLAAECSEEIEGNWEKFARNNRLNDYFIQSTPSWSQPTVNYAADLNALSVIEQKIGLNIVVLAPGAVDTSQLGWVANFKIDGITVSTPFMLTEAYARCFNILLFLKLSRTIKQLGIES